MINNIDDALNAINKEHDITEYDIKKAYECNFGNEHYYAFRLCKKGFEDLPGVTSFLINVFSDGNVVSGSQIMEPPGGKEVAL